MARTRTWRRAQTAAVKARRAQKAAYHGFDLAHSCWYAPNGERRSCGRCLAEARHYNSFSSHHMTEALLNEKGAASLADYINSQEG